MRPSTRRTAIRAARPPAAGFTLLELLTVIGIIATLSAIVAVAFNVVGNNAAARRTRVAIETCMSLQTEYETAVSLTSNTKLYTTSASNLTSATLDDGGMQFYRVLRLFRSVPANKDMEDKMSANAVESVPAPVWTSAPVIHFYVGDVVSDGAASPTYYSCIQDNDSGAHTLAETAFWTAGAAAPIFVVPKDGWDKGMRFVGNGLTDVKADPNGSKGWYGNVVTMPAGYTLIKDAIRSTNGRPFWVSAGPDGDFATHDDNVYSFEN